MPVGCQVTMDKPESVRRVTPPRITMANTSTRQSCNQRIIARSLSLICCILACYSDSTAMLIAAVGRVDTGRICDRLFIGAPVYQQT